ncbi:MAG TPA: hypothetical protein VF442_04410 [Sphingobium sp.]
MKRLQTTDFDVITGPSMASACPVVETAPLTETPRDMAVPEAIPTKSEQPVTAAKADAA